MCELVGENVCALSAAVSGMKRRAESVEAASSAVKKRAMLQTQVHFFVKPFTGSCHSMQPNEGAVAEVSKPKHLTARIHY